MVHVKIYIKREYGYNSNNLLVSEKRERERDRGRERGGGGEKERKKENVRKMWVHEKQVKIVILGMMKT